MNKPSQLRVLLKLLALSPVQSLRERGRLSLPVKTLTAQPPTLAATLSLLVARVTVRLLNGAPRKTLMARLLLLSLQVAQTRARQTRRRLTPRQFPRQTPLLIAR
jgi:hypothetical protein